MTETLQTEEKIDFHPAVKLGAKIVSVIFHPLFIPVYMGWFFLYVLNLFPQLDSWNKSKLIISFVLNYSFLPLVTMLIARKLGFIPSLQLTTQKERIIPYIITGIFYFWVWYVFKNQHFPKTIVMFSLAIFIANSMGLLLNSFIKLSMHGMAVGVVATILIIVGLRSYDNLGYYISVIFLLGGLVASSRLVNGDHSPRELYTGIFIGMLAQLIAFLFVR